MFDGDWRFDFEEEWRFVRLLPFDPSPLRRRVHFLPGGAPSGHGDGRINILIIIINDEIHFSYADCR